MLNYIEIHNNETIEFRRIPVLTYQDFLEANVSLLNQPECHCVSYYGLPGSDEIDGAVSNGNNKIIRLICCIADDERSVIMVSSADVEQGRSYESMTAHHIAFNMFEREISENFGIKYSDHPWLKPVRYPFDRYDNTSQIAGYPFYGIESEELHEVGVGPIHAGVIEPGHFRFICKGEQIQHLEIQLGYQHRGVESLFVAKDNLLQRTLLAESIAGDTTAGHATAFVNLWESLCEYEPDRHLQFSRTLALEIERIAIHTGDLSAICADIAYQTGSAVFGRLRTPVINFFQLWSGNRFAKGLTRAGYTNFLFTEELKESLLSVLNAYQPDFDEMINKFFHNPGSLSRLEKTGVVTTAQAVSIGAVGMAARSSGLERDIRKSHPFFDYKNLNHNPVVKHHGDVFSRTQMRREEITQSIGYIKQLLQNIPQPGRYETTELKPRQASFTLSLVEGWRGEICHCAVTGKSGRLLHYKIKDPSFHNWLALALAVRKNEISDFPICNKSFNLSYCGFDL